VGSVIVVGRGVDCFVLGWGEHSYAGMAPYRIVPAFYPLEDGRGNLGASCPDSGVEKFQPHRAPERFDQRVVVAVPIEPMDGTSPASSKRRPKAQEVNWLPWSECKIVACRSGVYG